MTFIFLSICSIIPDNTNDNCYDYYCRSWIILINQQSVWSSTPYKSMDYPVNFHLVLTVMIDCPALFRCCTREETTSNDGQNEQNTTSDDRSFWQALKE